MKEAKTINIIINEDQKELIIQSLKSYFGFLHKAMEDNFPLDTKEIFLENIEKVTELINYIDVQH